MEKMKMLMSSWREKIEGIEKMERTEEASSD